MKTTQTWRQKKFKVQKIDRNEGKSGINAWRYVKYVAEPLMWPECQKRDVILMEDNAPSHSAVYTAREREKHNIEKLDWPANSPDFNPIERIWALMKKRILRRRGVERITTVSAMREVLKEEWQKISIDEINKEIDRLPTVMARCIEAGGSNNYNS